MLVVYFLIIARYKGQVARDTEVHEGWWRRSIPCGLALVLALVVRLVLLWRTQGVMDGDEATLGIQAQMILRGAWPVYYPGQAYFGSLEAYLIALVFLVSGQSASVWALRMEPLLLSLVLVVLTWRVASLLSERGTWSRRSFPFLAALFAAVPPLYDAVDEARAWGGWIELYVVMLLLLWVTIQIARWVLPGAHSDPVKKTWKEQCWRWASLGFLIGLGFWIYPLIAPTVGAIVLWLAVVCLLRRSRPQWLPMLTLPPTALLGFAPGLIWGWQNQWKNLAFILGLASSRASGQETLKQRVLTVVKVTQSFGTCVAPRLIGGGLPVESKILTLWHLVLFAGGLSLLVLALFACWSSQEVRSLLRLPFLVGGCIVACFCFSSAATSELGRCTNDWAGRYASPLLIVLPLLWAGGIAWLWHRGPGCALPSLRCFWPC